MDGKCGVIVWNSIDIRIKKKENCKVITIIRRLTNNVCVCMWVSLFVSVWILSSGAQSQFKLFKLIYSIRCYRLSIDYLCSNFFYLFLLSFSPSDIFFLCSVCNTTTNETITKQKKKSICLLCFELDKL